MAISINGIAPLIQVFDMPVSLAFYRDKLGFKVIEPNPLTNDDCDWVLLQLDNVQLMLNTAYEKNERPEKEDKQRINAHSDTCFYFGCLDIENTYRQMKATGLEVEQPVITHYGFKAINLKDPDGYALCFHCPINE